MLAHQILNLEYPFRPKILNVLVMNLDTNRDREQDFANGYANRESVLNASWLGKKECTVGLLAVPLGRGKCGWDLTGACHGCAALQQSLALKKIDHRYLSRLSDQSTGRPAALACRTCMQHAYYY